MKDLEILKAAIFNVRIETPIEVLVDIKGVDYDTAYATCELIVDTNKDKVITDMVSKCMNSFGFMGYCGNYYSVTISAHKERKKTGIMHTCQSLIRDLGPWEKTENIDE